MRKWVMAAIMTAAFCAPVNAQEKGFGSSLVLFADANYSGDSITARGDLSAMGRETRMNDRASSLRVSGSWEICSDSNFRGRCVVVSEDVPDLKILRMNDNISSVRPKTGFGGGGGGGGSNVTKYDSPRWQGVPLFYCGKSLLNCGKRNADAYCKLMGHDESFSESAGARTNGRGFIAVEQSYQTGGMMFSSISCIGGKPGGEHGGNGPGFGGGGAQPSTNYPNPTYQGAAIAYCGKGGANCGEPNANAFCRSMGHPNAVSFTEGARTSNQVFSPAEMSFQRGGRTFKAISCAGSGGQHGGNGPGFGGGNGPGFGGGNNGGGFSGGNSGGNSGGGFGSNDPK